MNSKTMGGLILSKKFAIKTIPNFMIGSLMNSENTESLIKLFTKLANSSF